MILIFLPQIFRKNFPESLINNVKLTAIALAISDSKKRNYRITSIKRRGRLLNFSIFRGGGGGGVYSRGAFIKFWRFSSHIKLKKPTKFLKVYNISSFSSSFSSSIRLCPHPKVQTGYNHIFSREITECFE